MKTTSIPTINLSTEQKIWLNEAWKILKDSGRKVSYQKIRANTIDRTGKAFNPNNIDGRLATNNSTNITLLGLLSINPEEEIFNFFDIVLLHIKEYLIENPRDFEFKILDFAQKLDLEEKTVGLIFYLLQFCGSFYDGGGSSGEHNYIWLERYEIKSGYSFDTYMRFENFSDYLSFFYLGISTNNKANAIRNYNKAPSRFYHDNSRDLTHVDSFVDNDRIKEIRELDSDKFDLTKLINLCQEINVSYTSNCFFSTGILTRVIIDHIPPIFGKATFLEVTNVYGTRSFRDSMINLNKSSRKIADAFLHTKVRKKESLPNSTQIDFRSDLDVLLMEIVRILS